MDQPKIYSAGILSIGDELLIGQVINTNASWISEQLKQAGIQTKNHLSVADEKEDIIEGLQILSRDNDMVLITGGLGPTKDDITKTAIVDFFDDELAFHEDTFIRLGKLMKRFGREVGDNQRVQCELPKKATIYKNDLGTAPGMYLMKNDVQYFFMPGVPFEMKHLFSDRFMPLLIEQELVSDRVMTSTILTAGIGESRLEDKISDIVESFPDNLSISYLPGKAQVRVRLTAKNSTQAIIDQYKDAIVERLSTTVFGYGDDRLEAAVGRLLIERNLTLGFAESCTGGSLSASITSVSGASQYYQGSIISYANEIKQNVLQVSEQTIEEHGAVSKACVEEMVKGALNALDVDVAVAISGIAGPTGGSEEKPVGTVFIGVGNKNVVKVKHITATKTRHVNILYFTSYALNLLRLFLMEEYKM